MKNLFKGALLLLGAMLSFPSAAQMSAPTHYPVGKVSLALLFEVPSGNGQGLLKYLLNTAGVIRLAVGGAANEPVRGEKYLGLFYNTGTGGIDVVDTAENIIVGTVATPVGGGGSVRAERKGDGALTRVVSVATYQWAEMGFFEGGEVNMVLDDSIDPELPSEPKDTLVNVTNVIGTIETSEDYSIVITGGHLLITFKNGITPSEPEED